MVAEDQLDGAGKTASLLSALGLSPNQSGFGSSVKSSVAPPKRHEPRGSASKAEHQQLPIRSAVRAATVEAGPQQTGKSGVDPENYAIHGRRYLEMPVRMATAEEPPERREDDWPRPAGQGALEGV